MIYQC
jgi:hypothetical protein